MKRPLEVATEHERYVRIGIALPQKPLRQFINTAGMIQPANVIRRVRIQIEITPEADVLDAHQPHCVIEMVQHVFDCGPAIGPHELPHGGDPENAPFACGCLNNLVRLTTRNAWRKGTAVGVCNQDRSL